MPSAAQNNSNNNKNPKFSQAAMQKINQQNQQKQKNQPSQRKVSQRRGYQSRPNASQSQMFYDALTCPFDPNVLGVQVPDPFPFPTQVYHVHQTTVIGANTSTNPGQGCISFLPNPCLSMIDLTQINNLTATFKNVKNTPFTAYTPTNSNAPGNAIYGAVTPGALADVFADYRLVSWGIKISNLQPELSATGRIIIAQIPLGDTVPSYPTLQSSLSGKCVESIYGMDPAFLATSNILELPTGFQVTVQDLLHGDIEIGGMYSNADFWDFKTTKVIGDMGTSQSTGQIFSGDDTAFSNTGTIWTVGYKDLTRCRSGSAIVIYFEGMPSKDVENYFQVETIYHLEGTPNFSSTNNNALVSSTARKAAVGTTQNIEQVMTKASKIENVVTWISKGADFLNKNKATFAKIGSAAMAFL
nr:MAG: hypothetical protein [Narnaviridae sp.]